MTGKELKAFAERVPDEAVVEVRAYDFGTDWKEIDKSQLRGVLTVLPKQSEYD